MRSFSKILRFLADISRFWFWLYIWFFLFFIFGLVLFLVSEPWSLKASPHRVVSGHGSHKMRAQAQDHGRVRLRSQLLLLVYVAAGVSYSLEARLVEHLAWLSPGCNSQTEPRLKFPAAVSKRGRAGVPAPRHVPLEHRRRVDRLWEVIWAVVIWVGLYLFQPHNSLSLLFFSPHLRSPQRQTPGVFVLLSSVSIINGSNS